MSIILFSRPIHSGKTSDLLKWCIDKHVHGILMPDINGERKIMDMNTKEVFDIECRGPVLENEELTTIGKYSFYTAAFEKANSILLQALTTQPDWLIVDEAGKLELDGKGFYPSLKKIIPAYINERADSKLIITVRDGLLNAVIDFFNLANFTVTDRTEGFAGA